MASEEPQGPLVATRLSTPRSPSHPMVSKDAAAADDLVADLTHDFDDMRVDSSTQKANEEEDLGPFNLPSSLTDPVQNQPSPQPSQLAASPNHTAAEAPAQPTSPVTINSTATSTATSRSISKATSNVTMALVPNPVAASQLVSTPIPS
ncbi:hypothetical protein RhiJN_24887 [Ceratobasidium sp. AG-Ba]|nr:hypothetical protein RhiJN_24887 [Ceratobasidium sp. AG-Ba]